MAAITQQQLENASADADALGEIVNGSAERPNPGKPDGTVTTRLGQTLPTIANIMARTEEVYLTPARANYFGVGNEDDARVFVAQTIELDFVRKYYRDGFDVFEQITDAPWWNVVGTPAPINEAGMVVYSPASPEIELPGTGDWTLYAEVELPANIGERNVFFSYIGSAPERRILAYRNEDGFYVLELYGDASGQIIRPYMQDSKSRKVRVAVSCSAQQTTMVIDGGPPETIVAPRPEALLRAWIGTITLGSGTTLPQTFKTILRRNRASSTAELQAMTGGVPLGDGGSEGSEELRSHEIDTDAHDLESIRRDIAIARSEGGIWSVKAADTFAGADNSPLGNTETGGLPWLPAGSQIVRRGGRARHSTDGFGGAWIASGYSDGQVEADLYPGSVAAGGEASFYFRINDAESQYFLLQRAAPGDIGLYINVGAGTVLLAPIVSRPVVDGERYIVRFVGSRIFVFRKFNGNAELIYDITEPRLIDGKKHGIRLNGGGSVDNIRFLAREPLV